MAHFSAVTLERDLPLFLDQRWLAIRRDKQLLRILAQDQPLEERHSFAQHLVSAVIRRYWQALEKQRNVKLPIADPLLTPGRPLDATAQALVEVVGENVAKLDVPEAAYAIGTLYTALLPEKHRSAFGIYYTPPCVAESLLDSAIEAGVDLSNARVIDPACGGGAILAPVAIRMTEATTGRPRHRLASIAARLRGIEIEPFGAWMAHLFAEAALFDLCAAAGERLPAIVAVRDTLDGSNEEGAYDLVIGNPPYGRTRLPDRLRARYARSLYGHANLYGVFTDAALRMCRIGGHIAFVTPTSFLSGEYFKRLRALLAVEAGMKKLIFIAARKGVFDDVLQETALATFEKGSESTEGQAAALHVENETEASTEELGKFHLPKIATEPWLIPRRRDQSSFLHVLYRLPHRLSDYGYRVSTGPLVWNRHKSQLSATRTESCLPLIWAEAVQGGGVFEFRAARRNHLPYFRIQTRDDWLIVRRPCILVQRTTAKEQVRRLIAAELPAVFIERYRGVVVENHLNMVLPDVARPAVSLRLLTTLMNSLAVDEAFRCMNGSVAVSAFELEALPLPAPSALGPLNELIAGAASKLEIEREIARLYGH